MNFNKTIPELSVFDINKSKNFYLNVLGAKIEYERQEDKFVFLSLEENQLMLEEIHD
ncbi:glyoxalase superfamily protein, partial [Bacillus cereus]